MNRLEFYPLFANISACTENFYLQRWPAEWPTPPKTLKPNQPVH